jgi:hypothetical protein
MKIKWRGMLFSCVSIRRARRHQLASRLAYSSGVRNARLMAVVNGIVGMASGVLKIYRRPDVARIGGVKLSARLLSRLAGAGLAEINGS